MVLQCFASLNASYNGDLWMTFAGNTDHVTWKNGSCGAVISGDDWWRFFHRGAEEKEAPRLPNVGRWVNMSTFLPFLVSLFTKSQSW